MTQAAGAGLVAVTATSCAAASVNVLKGTVNVRYGLVLETATVAGAASGGLAAAHIPDRALIGGFGALLAAITLLLWRNGREEEDAPGGEGGGGRGELGGEYFDAAAGRFVAYAPTRLPAGLFASFLAGNLSGLLGVGGGVLKVPVMHLYCGMPMKAAAATSNFMIGVTAATSALVYFARGDIDPVLSGTVAFGVLAGSRLGAHAGSRFKDANLRRLFALLTLFLSVQMLRRSFGGG